MSYVKSQGYAGYNYTVQTSDGYILDIFRVYKSSSSSNSNEQTKDSSSSSSSSSSSEETERPVMLLMHGFLSSSDDFILPGINENRMAFYFADKGYDVFIGNVRGNIYGRRHKSLNPERDAAFWQFCWDEIGTRDLPAIIDKILTVTGQSRLYYVGHMQGSTVFYVMASEMPEYNSKIYKMASVGPVAYLGQSDNPVLKQIERHFEQKSVSVFKIFKEFISA